MSRIASSLAVACLGWLAGVSSADMIIQGYDPALHERFYAGPGGAFIGGTTDWSGIGRTASGTWATMISPSYFVTAAHAPTTPGSTVTFWTGNNFAGPTSSYTVASAMQIGSTDVYLGKLSQPVSNVAIYPILSLPTNTDYYGQTVYTWGNSTINSTTQMRLGRNVINAAGIPGQTTQGIESYSFNGETTVIFNYSYDHPGLGADESLVQGGDSGGPSMVMTASGPALVGTHWLLFSPPGNPDPNNPDPNDPDPMFWSADAFLPAYINDLMLAMAGSGEQLTTVSAVPEPASLLLLLGTMLTVASRYMSKRLRAAGISAPGRTL